MSDAGTAFEPASLFDHYWDFDHVEDGQALDAVASDVTLSLSSPDALGPGVMGTAPTLQGADSMIDSEGLRFDPSGDFSLSVWVQLSLVHSFDTVVSQAGENVSAFYLQKRSDDRWSFATFSEDDTGASPCVTSGSLQPKVGEWYHLAATREAATGEQRLYVDGMLLGRASCAAAPFAAKGELSVGRGTWDGQGADAINGSVDELGIASRVLSADEIVNLYRQGRPNASYYLFAYFVEVGQGRGDGLRLAYSHDGLYWGAIGESKVFMPPMVGGGSFRDPHVMRAPDGNYHLVFTTSCVPWAESNCVQDRGFGHAWSTDLVHWNDQVYIPVDLQIEHAWAPETIYDEATSQFMVYWSSPLNGQPHSIYYLLTKDFVDFGTPAVLYTQSGRNFIDATIRRQGDQYLMVLKDEADGQKNLRALASSALFGDGAWSDAPSAPLTGNYGAEGPSLLERDGQLFVYFDKYDEGAYGALRADESSALTDPKSWTDVSGSVFFPGVRHGTPIEVPWDVFRAVALAAAE